jgi:hypothetical protein
VSSIYLPDELKNKLIQGARRRGFRVERGPQSQLGDYIEYLVRLDEQKGNSLRRQTLSQALGLLSAPDRDPVTDQQVDQLLSDRRLSL